MKKIFIFISLIGLLGLSGCAGTGDLIVTQNRVITPPKEFLNCHVGRLPDKFTSNKDVAKFMVKTYHDNAICKYSINKLEQYYKKAQENIH